MLCYREPALIFCMGRDFISSSNHEFTPGFFLYSRYDVPDAVRIRRLRMMSTSKVVLASALMLLAVGVGVISPENSLPSNGVNPSHGFSSQSVATPVFCVEMAKTKGCDNLPGECLDCDFDCNCVYGSNVTVDCMPKKSLKCLNNDNGPKRRTMICRYCYQSPPEEHVCEHNSTCQVRQLVIPSFTGMGREILPKNRGSSREIPAH